MKEIEKLPGAPTVTGGLKGTSVKDSEYFNFIKDNVQKSVSGEIKKGFVPNDFKVILGDPKNRKNLLDYAKKNTPDVFNKFKQILNNPTSKKRFALYSKLPAASIPAGIALHLISDEAQAADGAQATGFTTGEKLAGAGAAAGAYKFRKPIIKTAGKGLNLGFGPSGALALTLGFKPEGGYDLSRTGDRIGFEAEAALAKPLVKQVLGVTDKIKNPIFKKIAERASLAGMSPAFALKAARTATPLGLGALGVEGLYNVAKYSEPSYYIGPDGEPTFYKREKAADVLPTMLDVYEQADKISREQGIPYQEALNQVNFERFGKLSMASGGLANLTDTIPPESGPMSEGLRSLYNNGRKL